MYAVLIIGRLVNIDDLSYYICKCYTSNSFREDTKFYHSITFHANSNTYILDRELYITRILHLLYYLTPDEFKTDPETTLDDHSNLSNAFLCFCCNSSLLLYQLYRCWNRIVVDKFRALFNCLCGCIIVRRRRTRNNNDDFELPISHPIPLELPLQDNWGKRESTIEEYKLQKSNENNSMCNTDQLCRPEPVVILTTPPRSAPMSVTKKFHPSSSSPSSTATVVTSGSSNNNVQDYAA